MPWLYSFIFKLQQLFYCKAIALSSLITNQKSAAGIPITCGRFFFAASSNFLHGVALPRKINSPNIWPNVFAAVLASSSVLPVVPISTNIEPVVYCSLNVARRKFNGRASPVPLSNIFFCKCAATVKLSRQLGWLPPPSSVPITSMTCAAGWDPTMVTGLNFVPSERTMESRCTSST